MVERVRIQKAFDWYDLILETFSYFAFDICCQILLHPLSSINKWCTLSLLMINTILLGDNMPDADSMELIDQVSAYDQCGLKIKSDLLGNLDLLRRNLNIDSNKYR
jgi:hypothetical protein